MQLRLSDHNSDILRNRSTDKIVGRILVSGSNGADIGTQINAILHATQIKLVLRRGGEETVIFQDKMGLIALLSSLYRPLFPTILDYVHKYSGVYPYTNDYLFGEGSATVLPFILDLGCIINLGGNDELFLDATCTAQQLSTVTNANINFEFEEAVGVGDHIMCTRFESVPPGQSSWNRDLGNNVCTIAFINLDNAAVDASTAPISDIQVNADKVSLSDSYYDLLLRRYVMCNDAETAKKSYNNFIIYHGTELDKVKLNFSLVSAAVNQGKNFVAHRFFVTDEKLLAKADGMRQKHQGRDLMKHAQSTAVVAHAQNLIKGGSQQQKAHE